MPPKTTGARFTHLTLRVLAILFLAIGFISVIASQRTSFNINSASAQQQEGIALSFTKSFSPSTIGPGSVSTLAFQIDNPDPVNPFTDLAFTDPLPVGMEIASPANATSTCTGGTLDAPDGGATITFSGGGVGAGSSCTLTVDVTTGTVEPQTFPNVSEDLTWSVGTIMGSTGGATADLTVDLSRPGFSKRFSPSTVPLGSRSTLTFTIDNTANDLDVFSLTFTDNLPAGLEVANPANASTDCSGGQLTATSGTSIISYSPLFFGDASVSAGASCTVSVDVLATGVGSLDNISGELTSISSQVFQPRSSGKASASLEVTVGTIALIKSFTDDPAPPGGTATLEFTLTNFDRNNAASNIAFTDDLNAALSGIAAVAPLPTEPCGAGSQLSGTSLLSLSGGGLAAGESCTFSVVLQVPPGAASGTYTNTTSPVTAEIGGDLFAGDPATDKLFVAPIPSLTKSFTNDPVTAGDTVTLEFTITNGSSTSSATDITFTDEFAVVLPTASSVPTGDFCGAGSSATFTPLGTFNLANLIVSGASLGPGASCTFSITLDVATDAPTGIYPNTTSDITATVDNETVTGEPATDDLSIVTAPDLIKSFSDDPVVPGDSVTLEFTLIHDENAPTDATNITFTDDLGAVLPGLTATGLPINNICGQGSELNGTTFLSFTGGSLSPTESCTFSVTLQVPADAFPGAYSNTTSDVSATVQGLAVSQQPGSDTLDVVSVLFDKSFTKNPVVPGETVPLSFTLRNMSTVSSTTNIIFLDDLGAVLSGLSAVDTPQNDICGAGSQISGTSTLIFTGGSLAPGASCTFEVTLMVPAGAADGTYNNSTSDLSFTFDGTPLTIDPATDSLTVDSNLLLFTKAFTDDPVISGGTTTLEFTISNASPVSGTTNIAFTDDLDAALSGLIAVDTPQNDICGTGSQISGTDTLIFTGGSLAAGASCTFSVTLQVPSGIPFGSTATNTTSQITGELDGGFNITGDPATDDLQIDSFLFSKAFDGATTATGTPILSFTIENLNTASTSSGLSFLDDLDAVLPGLTATGLPANDVCGAGSQLSGTSVLNFTGGNLGPGSSCTFNVTLQVPITAPPGTYNNTTTGLSETGILVSSPASDTLTVEPPPIFTKSFAPAFIGVGFDSTLIFAIDNTASALPASSLDFTDNLPSGVAVADPPNASTTCTGGTLTAVAGTGVISYSGGTVPAGASCNVQVSVTGTSAGAHVNTTGELTSSSGSSGMATDTLTVNPQPEFSKSFAPNPILVGETSTLSLVIDNTGSTVDATSLDFTDNLPSDVVVATPANASTTCTGGTLTASAGTGTITYSGGTVPAGASCSVSVDVTSSAPGAYANTTGSLTSSLGTSGTASATLTVDPVADLSLLKSDSPDPVFAGGTLTYTLTISNSGPSQATGVAVTDTLPAAFSPLGNSCGASGSPLVWNVGTLPANGGASCTITGTVEVGLSASITNTATVTSDAFDPEPTNNTASATTLVEEMIPEDQFKIYLPLIFRE